MRLEILLLKVSIKSSQNGQCIITKPREKETLQPMWQTFQAILSSVDILFNPPISNIHLINIRVMSIDILIYQCMWVNFLSTHHSSKDIHLSIVLWNYYDVASNRCSYWHIHKSKLSWTNLWINMLQQTLLQYMFLPFSLQLYFITPTRTFSINSHYHIIIRTFFITDKNMLN